MMNRTQSVLAAAILAAGALSPAVIDAYAALHEQGTRTRLRCSYMRARMTWTLSTARAGRP